MHVSHINELIDALDISDETKRRFKALNFMYYNNYADGILRLPQFWKTSPEYDAIPKTSAEAKDMKCFSTLGTWIASYMRQKLLLSALLAFAFLIGSFIFKPSIYAFIFLFISLILAPRCYVLLNRQDDFYEKCLKNKPIR